MSGQIEGESLERSRRVDGSLSASRTTADFKIDMNLRGQYEWEEYDFEQDDGSITSRDASTTEIDGSATAVWSISPHWSWGLSADAGTDSRANQDLYVRGGPALEFSLYPYADATSRQITAHGSAPGHRRRHPIETALAVIVSGPSRCDRRAARSDDVRAP
jgi:hypothetical protein